ncbi:hypothetical protein RJ640_009329 [Escallonia rubra]|uniref:Retrotransposon Copia-like N-terminal domain-containing protein n=1 Tax=Escallonia rubra TaxID=112253 RepID=A0AA88RTC4_9ASTE|nr:hypothetical protein RJ640_009329 [Escallonia rubra]
MEQDRGTNDWKAIAAKDVGVAETGTYHLNPNFGSFRRINLDLFHLHWLPRFPNYRGCRHKYGPDSQRFVLNKLFDSLVYKLNTSILNQMKGNVVKRRRNSVQKWGDSDGEAIVSRQIRQLVVVTVMHDDAASWLTGRMGGGRNKEADLTTMLLTGNSIQFIELMASEKAECLSVKLDGKHYSIWRFHFQYFVEGKGLWGYVDGSEPQPAAFQVKEATQWKVNNAKVISWILGSVDTSIGIPTRGLHTAKDMWEYLEKVYQQSNFSSRT